MSRGASLPSMAATARLTAMRLIIRYREAGFSTFGLRDVFRFQTISETAAYLNKHTQDSDTGLVSTIRPAKTPCCRLLLLPYACGNASSFIELSRFLPSNIEILAVSPSDNWDEANVSIQEMVRQILAAMPAGGDMLPLLVVGYSFGGFLACEIVTQLEKKGNPPHGVALIATTPPNARSEIDFIIEADDETILAYSREVYNFDSSEFSANEIGRYLCQLRAQTKAMAEYQFDFDKPLHTSVIVLIGSDEEDTEIRRKSKNWSDIFENVSQDVVPGRHMLIKTHSEALANRLTAFIKTIIKDKTVGVAAE